MKTNNLNRNEEYVESETSRADKSFVFFQKATVAFLLLGAAVSIYIAIFLGTGSEYFVLLLVNGVSLIFLARACWKGYARAFRIAIVLIFARIILGSILSGGISLPTILYLSPQILVIPFSVMTLMKMKNLSISEFV